MASELLTRICLPAQTDKLKHLREQVRMALEHLCHDPEQIDHLVIAINEASMNVIQHAYKDQTNGQFELEIFHSADQDGDQLIFRVIDFAAPVDCTSVRSPDHACLTPGGLGLQIIREIMDEMHFTNNTNGTGNIMEMKVRLNDSRKRNGN